MKRNKNIKSYMNFMKKFFNIMMLITISIITSSLTMLESGSAEKKSGNKIDPMEDKSGPTDIGYISTYNSSETSSILITKKVKKISIKPINTNANDIILTTQNKNIYRGKYDKGYLTFAKKNINSYKSKDYRTTKWFPVLSKQGKSLVLSGTAHNRATWQFKTSSGKILTEVGNAEKFGEVKDVLQDKTVSKIDIPEDAVLARVYFANYKDQDATLLDNNLQIEYGKISTHYQPSTENKIKLPTVKKGDMISFEDGKWSAVNKETSKIIDLEEIELQVGDTLSLSSNKKCEIQITWENENTTTKTGIYGVRWNRDDRNPVCERIEDAVGLHFNAVEGSTQLTPYENDFDNIYPWSDIKICAIKVLDDKSRKITYQGEKKFLLEGEAGNIMVEIPKFYCKREIIDNYEYLWISPVAEEGFTVDPSFITPDGEVDHIYVGAYLSSIKDNKLISVSQSHPLIKRSFGQLQKLAKNSNGFTGCDLLAIMTVQRLYLVETAVLDSQSVFSGNVNMPYLLKDKSTSYYGIKSEEQTNTITVKKTNMTLKFHKGDAVSVLSSWKEFDNSEEL